MAKLGQGPKARASLDEEEDEAEEMDDDDGGGAAAAATSRRGNNKKKKILESYVLTKPILSSFGRFSMNFFRIAPRPTFMLGSLDRGPLTTIVKKERKKRVVERVNEQAQTKIKELDANSKENDASSTFKETERIFKILKKNYKLRKRIGEIVLDRGYFSKAGS
jgi:hypothetical protein